MASERTEVRLVEVADIIMGQSPPGETYNDKGDGLPFFQGVADFNYRHPTPRVFCSAPSRVACPGDLLLSVRAPIGRVNVADRECAIGRGLAIIRPREPRDARYLELALRYLEPYWHTVEGGGSVFGNATRHDIERLAVAWPPAAERRAIAHILGTLDDKIELNRRMSETLEAMARALFKAWFVDFEPVRAKMDGRWRPGESLPGLPAHLYDLFPDRLVESELGEIPEGWAVGKIGDVAQQVREGVNPLEHPNALFQHFSIPAFDDGQWPKMELGQKIKSVKFRVPPDVVLLSKLNPEVERVWLVDLHPNDHAICSTEFVVLDPIPPHGRAYVYCLVRSRQFREGLEGLVTGTSKSHQRAQVSAIFALDVLEPPKSVLNAFETIAEPLLAHALACRRESRTLVALRDALLPKLIRGEIRVKDAERFLKERGL